MMPYKHTKKLIPKEYKRSAKLTDQDKADMMRIYGEGGISYRELGLVYGVAKRTAYFAVNPDKQKENHSLRQKRIKEGKSCYYDREKHTVAMRKHRAYKQELHLQNKLETHTENEMK